MKLKTMKALTKVSLKITKSLIEIKTSKTLK